MKNLGKSFANLLRALGFKSEPHKDQLKCDHGVSFDEQAAKNMTATEIKRIYPRLCGTCPKGCGYVGIAYASSMHYYMGDW